MGMSFNHHLVSIGTSVCVESHLEKLKLTPPLMETMEATMEATQIPAETGATEPEAAEAAKPLTLVSPSDEVGFGKHGLMTYEEAWVQEPQYCMWVITTFRKEISEGLEDETSWKEGDRMMKRFAQWLMEKEKNCEAHGPAFEYNADMELVEVPSSRSLRDRVGASQEKKAKFYGVAKPEKRICTSWEECKPFVHGVKGVLYRSFATREEAEAYINNPPASVRSQKQDTTGEGGEAKKKSKAKKKQSPEDSNTTEAQKGEDESPPVSKKRKSATKATTEVPKKSDEAVASEQTDSNKAEMKKAKKTPKVAATSKAKAKAKANPKAKAKAEAKTPNAKAAKVKAEESEEKNEKKAKAKAAKAAKVKAEESEDKKTKTKAASPDAPKTDVFEATEGPAGEGNGSNLSEEVLTTAENCGLKTALMNLAARPEIEKLQLDGHCLLQTLKECNGLVNKAKAQLLENGPSTPPKSQSTQSQTATTPEKGPTIPGTEAKAPEIKVAEIKVETNPEPQPMEIETMKATPSEPAQRTVPVSAVVAPVAQPEKKVLDENSCRNCETPFADSIFCRSCGMARPKKARVSAPPQQARVSAPPQQAAAPSPNIQEVIQANRERALARKRQAAAMVAGA